MNKLYEQEYDQKLKNWNEKAVSLQPLSKRAEEALNNGTIYYLSDADGLLLEREREASLQLNNIRKKLFETAN
jgi:hypothetical protein